MGRMSWLGCAAVCLLAVACMAAPDAGSGSLGDLTSFKKIAEDTLALVGKKQMPEAKARIKDLETAWDVAEETVKARNPAKWNSADKSIDKALAELRSSEPDPAACAKALKIVIAKFAVMGDKAVK